MTGDDLDTRAREIAAGLTFKQESMLRYASTYGYLPTPQSEGDWVAQDRLSDKGCSHLRMLTDLGRAVARVLAEGGAK